jgi:multicomponent Na+:H+ antiporter subunit E
MSALPKPTPALLGRLPLFALLWLILAGAAPGSWLIGVPTVALAALASVRLARGRQLTLSPIGAARFVPYFLWQSLRGGLDVAARVLRPRLRIAPGLQQYPLRLTTPQAQVFFLDAISLLPGTLSADLRGCTVELHALDASIDLTPGIADLERRVGRVFGEELAGDDG